MSRYLLQIQDLWCKSDEKYRLKGISLELQHADFFGIYCKDQLAKKELISILLNQKKDFHGTVKLAGTNQKQIIELLSETPSVLPKCTVKENLSSRRLGIKNFDKSRYQQALQIFNLKEIEKIKASKLAPLQKILVQLARVWLNKTDLLLVDEPAHNLDEEDTYNLLCALQEIHRQKISILMFSNSKDLLCAACKCAELSRGQLFRAKSQKPRNFFGQDIHYLDYKQKVSSMMSYLRALEPIESFEDYKKIVSTNQNPCVQIWSALQTSWLDLPELIELIEENFENMSVSSRLLILTKITKRKSLASQKLIPKYFSNLAELDFAAEDWLYLLNLLPQIDLSLISPILPIPFLFQHPSEKVRADAIKMLSHPELIYQLDIQELVMNLLKDSDYRVVANTLDYLAEFPFYDTTQLHQFNFAQYPHHRVQASWCRLLDIENKQEEKFKIIEKMLASNERSTILAAVWVLSRHPSFLLSEFFEMESELNPHIFVYTDDIIRVAQSVKSKIKNQVSIENQKQSA